MGRIGIGFASVAAILTATLSCGPDARPKGELELRIESLCEILSAGPREERDRAGQELAKIGKPAFRPVKQLTTAPDADTAARAKGVLVEIAKALRPRALQLQVSSDRTTYDAGEGVELQVRLANVEEFSVVAARFDESKSAARIQLKLFHQGKAIEAVESGTSISPAPGSKLDETSFFTLAPGESFALRTLSFRGWKPSRGDLPKVAFLNPGSYKAVVTYDFQKQGSSRAIADSGQRAYQEAWDGVLTGEAEFKVDATDDEIKVASARDMLRDLSDGIERHLTNSGVYPAGGNREMLQALVGDAQAALRKTGQMRLHPERYIINSRGEAVDPWGRPIIYRDAGETFLLYSCGPNRRDEGGDGDDLR